MLCSPSSTPFQNAPCQPNNEHGKCFLRFLAKEECSFNLSGYVCKFVTQLVKGRREKYSVCGGRGVDRRAAGDRELERNNLFGVRD